MIKINEANEVEIEYEITYSVSSNTYNIVSEYMDDNCKPYKIADGVMIWLDDKGLIGEIESIFLTHTFNSEGSFSCSDEIVGNIQISIQQEDSECMIEERKSGSNSIVYLKN